MKINRIIIAAMAAAAAVSCQKEASFESGNQMLEPMTISTEVQTKTSLNGSEIHWTSEAEFTCSNQVCTLSADNATIEINSSYNLESAKVVIKNLNVKYGTK